jgi:DNA replication protein DnaC
MERLSQYAKTMKHTPFLQENHRMSDIRSEQERIERQHVCSICKGTGYLRMDVPVGHQHFGKLIPCQCTLEQRKQQQQQRLIEASGLHNLARFRNASFDTYNPFLPGVRTAYTQALEFASHPSGWLILVGGYGCGKTHLAVSIAKKQLADGNLVALQVVPRLLDSLRASFSPNGEHDYDERFQQLCDVDLLILDDFGSQNNTPWATEKLFQLLNHRYNAHAPTVITMNTTSWQQAEPRLYSRFHDTQLVHLIIVSQANDYRIQGQS